jgi:hypothetical protein
MAVKGAIGVQMDKKVVCVNYLNFTVYRVYKASRFTLPDYVLLFVSIKNITPFQTFFQINIYLWYSYTVFKRLAH